MSHQGKVGFVVQTLGVQETAFRMRRDGDVLVVSVHGLYRPATHRAMRAAIAQELDGGDPARAVVADIRHALCTFDEQDREDLVFEAVTATRPVTVPIGLVVPEPLFNASVRMCACAWSHGRLWVTFHDLADAVEWAAVQRVKHPPRVQADALQWVSQF